MPVLHFAHPLGLAALLVSLPLAYVLLSYGYLAWWHQKPWLLNTVIHENGRLTLIDSLLYFDHFVACVPMVTVFALCAVGGVALTSQAPVAVPEPGRGVVAVLCLGAAAALVVGACVASVLTVGWQRTMDYALQRIERDGVMSKGGNWNQLQLSNVPIALGAVGLGGALRPVGAEGAVVTGATTVSGGIACIAAAVAIVGVMSMGTWCGWAAFGNPRWLAHSLRELATFPLTGIPIALASVVLAHAGLSGAGPWVVQAPWPSLLLFGVAGLIVMIQLALVRHVDVLALAQRPSFAASGLSLSYLLAAHVFEHVLDFVLLALLAAGLYASLYLYALA